MNADNILESITKKNRIARGISLIIGAFIIALIYNSFIVPNNIVYGGIGGIAIIFNKITGFNTTSFINIITILLTIISCFIVGYKKTSYTIFGFLTYAIMVNVTSFISNYFIIKFDSFVFTIIFYGLIAGIGFGLLYRAGFNTGGADTLIVIAQKYFEFPTSKLSNIINGIIIIVGAATFGIVNSIYAVIYLKLINFISDKIILGYSLNKICFIKSKHIKVVEELLTNDLEVGYTLIDSTNGIGIIHKTVIMCVVPTDRFYDFKQELLQIDKRVELISNDCYTVSGGKTNELVSV